MHIIRGKTCGGGASAACKIPRAASWGERSMPAAPSRAMPPRHHARSRAIPVACSCASLLVSCSCARVFFSRACARTCFPRGNANP